MKQRFNKGNKAVEELDKILNNHSHPKTEILPNFSEKTKAVVEYASKEIQKKEESRKEELRLLNLKRKRKK